MSARGGGGSLLAYILIWEYTQISLIGIEPIFFILVTDGLTDGQGGVVSPKLFQYTLVILIIFEHLV